MKTEVKLLIGIGQSLAGAGHLCGRRRSGLPDPLCPSCSGPMLCLFSLDGRDLALWESPLGPADGDWDFFVCYACKMYLSGYHTRIRSDRSVDVLPSANPGEAPRAGQAVTPYPAFPVTLQVGKPGIRPFRGPEGNEPGDHRISPLHYGQPPQTDQDQACPFCEGRMIPAAILDADPRLGLQRKVKAEIKPASLDWAGGYLAVTLCRDCHAFGYHAARG